MGYAIGLVAIGLAGWLLVKLRRLKAYAVELSNDLLRAREERDEAAEERDNLVSRVEQLDKENEKLDRECNRLDVENKLRREYAYVCDECKTHNPAVRQAREQSLRSVTGGPKR